MILAKVVRFRAEPSDKLVSYVLQSNWKYPGKNNRIWSDVLVTFSQFEESRENQDSKSVTRTTIKVVANLHSPEKRICHEICILDNVFWIWEFLQEERYNADTPIGKIIVDEAWIPKAKRPSSRIQHVRLSTKKHANHVPKASTDSN